MGIASFQTRLAFDGTVLRKILREANQQLLPEIDVCDFAAAELNDSLDAIPFSQESELRDCA